MPVAITYEEVVGLTLNLGRAMTRKAEAVRAGVRAAMTDRPLDEAWHEAVADDPYDAARRINEDVNQCRETQILSKVGW